MKTTTLVLLILCYFSSVILGETLSLQATVRDFRPSHPDFERNSLCCGVETGIVRNTLGNDKKPVYVAQNSQRTTNAANFNQWFRDVSNVNLKFQRTLVLNQVGSSNVFEYSNNNFFPINGVGFPYSGANNYLFTLELHTQFVYQGGERLRFTSDDDLWVFINGQLAVDLGGLHPAADATLELDSLGLSIGQEYNFDLFFAERKTSSSVLKFQIPNSPIFDFLVVGAGAAGSIVAYRLSEVTSVTVGVVEAGNNDTLTTEPVPVPFLWPTLFRANIDWSFDSLPLESVGLRRIYIPRGKLLGGSTAVNAMNYVRGQANDFDRWVSDFGAVGWDYNSVLPYFKKSEDQLDINNPTYHGFNGPLTVRTAPYIFDVSKAFFNATLQAGYSYNPDFNGATQEGAGFYQKTINQFGARESAATAFLRTVESRPNAKIFVRTYATKIIFNNQKRAVGIEIVQDGTCKKLFARKEVILSGGAIGTAQLLLLSGVGPAADLQALGIPVVEDLPVGKNLQDHPLVQTAYNTAAYPPVGPQINDWLGEYFQFGTGPISNGGGDFGAFLKSDPSMPGPDFHFIFLGFYPNDFSVPGYVVVIEALNISSPPSDLKLNSKDPFDKPAITSNLLIDNNDLQILLKAVNISRNIMNQPAFAAFKGEGISFPFSATDAQVEKYLRAAVESGYHQCGTARMGDPARADTVVNPSLQVKGVSRLRVVDASVFPRVTSGNTQAPTYMVAEKGSDLIKQTYGL